MRFLGAQQVNPQNKRQGGADEHDGAYAEDVGGPSQDDDRCL